MLALARVFPFGMEKASKRQPSQRLLAFMSAFLIGGDNASQCHYSEPSGTMAFASIFARFVVRSPSLPGDLSHASGAPPGLSTEG